MENARTDVYARILSHCVEYLEKCRRYEQANKLLETLLSQLTYCINSHGRWWERLALKSDQHLKKYTEVSTLPVLLIVFSSSSDKS